MNSLPLALLSGRLFRALETHSKLAHTHLQHIECLTDAPTAASLGAAAGELPKANAAAIPATAAGAAANGSKRLIGVLVELPG